MEKIQDDVYLKGGNMYVMKPTQEEDRKYRSTP